MYPNLVAELKRKDKKYEDLSNLLSIGITTVNEKMNGKSDFKLKEFKIIKKEWFPNCSLDYLSVTKEEQQLREVQKKFKEAYRKNQDNIVDSVKYAIDEISDNDLKVDKKNNTVYNIAEGERTDFTKALKKQEWHDFYYKIDKHGLECKQPGSKNITIINDKIIKSDYDIEKPIIRDIYQATNNEILLSKYGIKTEDIIYDIYEMIEEDNVDERKVQKVIQDYFEKGLLGRYDSNNNLFVSENEYTGKDIESNNRNSREQHGRRDNISKTYKTNRRLDNSLFSLDKNSKRYSELTETYKLNYFQKDNGDIRINLLDTNSNLVNQFDVYSVKDAVKELGQELATEIYNSASDTEKNIYLGNDINKNDYKMNHRPSNMGAYGYDLLASDMTPRDIYDHPEYYSYFNKITLNETMKQLNKVRNKPDELLTIYRATTGDTINDGDWITLSKTYAEQHNESQFDGKGNIIEMQVPAKDIQWAGDVIDEFGYFPDSNSNISMSLSNKNSDIAPIGDYNVYGEDIKVKEAIEPLNNKIEELNQKIDKLVSTKEDINLSEDIAPIKNVVQDNEVAPIKSSKNTANLVRKETKVNDTLELKPRKWIETSLESKSVKGNVLLEDLNPANVFYEVQSNKTTLKSANNMLDNMGYDESINYFKGKIYDKNTTVEDVVLGERLIQEAIKKGDTAMASELIQDTAILGTELGRQVQALSLIQKMTPEGQLKMLQKVVERGKVKEDVAFNGVELTQEMVDKILSTYNQDGSFNQEALNDAVEEVKQELANQMNTTIGEKATAWRYLSMLGNPKTHIRNMVSNGAMKVTESLKNSVARTIQDIALKENKTRTWKQSSDYVKNYAMQVTEEMKSVISGESKYGETQSIKAKRDTFKNKILEKLYSFNSDMLEKEDWWFSKVSFKSNFQEFLTANGIVTEADVKANPKLVEKAKLYAVEQAQISTFRQYSALASMINKLESKSKVGKFAVEAIMPFKKTPINIARTGIDYSPVGFAKGVYQLTQIKNGVQASTAIDNISKGLTGSSLMALGYVLASAGMLNGAGDDDKEGKYDYQLGKQSYSVNVGNKTVSLSWLSPVAMPLFVGVNAYETFEEEMELSPDVITEALLQTLDPLNEMSVMSGVTSALGSYKSGVGKLSDIGTSAVQSYIGQYIPTLSSYIAATLDDTKRSTQSSSDSGFKLLDETMRKLMYKIPGLRNLLEPTTDIWGNEIKQSESLLERGFENFLAPYNTKNDITSKVDKEIKNIYKETGESKVMPSIPTSTVDYKGEKYKMSAKDYTEFKKKYGQTAYEMLEQLFKNSSYQNSDAEEQAKMIDKVYDYARDESKKEYLDTKGVEYTNTTKDKIPIYKENSIKGAINKNLTIAEYDYYQKSPKSYYLYKATGLKFDDYQKYQTELNDIKSDKDSLGQTINNSRKNKVLNYINDLNVDYLTKLLLYKNEYNSDDSYNMEIIQYIDSLNTLSYKEKLTVLEKLGFNVYADGSIGW